jgi:hypothetical protein
MPRSSVLPHCLLGAIPCPLNTRPRGSICPKGAGTKRGTMTPPRSYRSMRFKPAAHWNRETALVQGSNRVLNLTAPYVGPCPTSHLHSRVPCPKSHLPPRVPCPKSHLPPRVPCPKSHLHTRDPYPTSHLHPRDPCPTSHLHPRDPCPTSHLHPRDPCPT